MWGIWAGLQRLVENETLKRLRSEVEKTYVQLMQMECDRFVASWEFLEDFSFAVARAVSFTCA